MSNFIEFLHHYKDGVRHRSFRLTHDDGFHLREPHHALLVAVSVLMIVLNAQILYFYSLPASRHAERPKKQQVLGESVNTLTMDKSSQTSVASDLGVYQENVKLVLKIYLTNRATYFDGFASGAFTQDDMEDWSAGIEDAQDSLLSMVVPGRFKDLHIRLASAFAVERQTIIDIMNGSEIFSEVAFEKTTKIFQDILDDYAWLSG